MRPERGRGCGAGGRERTQGTWGRKRGPRPEERAEMGESKCQEPLISFTGLPEPGGHPDSAMHARDACPPCAGELEHEAGVGGGVPAHMALINSEGRQSLSSSAANPWRRTG